MPVTRKVVILGDSMVGKSNLAIRFARDEWAADTAPNFGAAFLVTVGVYGFATAAMLVPAIAEFDVTTGRTTAQDL